MAEESRGSSTNLILGIAAVGLLAYFLWPKKTAAAPVVPAPQGKALPQGQPGSASNWGSIPIVGNTGLGPQGSPYAAVSSGGFASTPGSTAAPAGAPYTAAVPAPTSPSGTDPNAIDPNSGLPMYVGGVVNEPDGSTTTLNPDHSWTSTYPDGSTGNSLDAYNQGYANGQSGQAADAAAGTTSNGPVAPSVPNAFRSAALKPIYLDGYADGYAGRPASAEGTGFWTGATGSASTGAAWRSRLVKNPITGRWQRR